MPSSFAPQTRRGFLHAAGAAVAAGIVLSGKTHASTMDPHASTHKTLKPPRLKHGDTVGLVNPAGITYARADLDIVAETLAALGLSWKFGNHVSDRYGYLAGADADRAADVNAMFADPGVHAVMAIRGGWGCNRILHLLDYNTIVRNPKILIGYSDITSLLLACNAKTGLVTFHGPVGVSTWNKFSVGYFKRVVMDAGEETFRNPREQGDNLTQTKDRVHTITPGKARGILLGGNLSVLAAMIGSPYLPAWEKVILFLEDDGENIYRVDRMLTHLRLAGILDRLAGFVFGKCTDCGAGGGYGSLTLEDVFRDLISPLGIPAFSGAMIGHIENKFTVPLGIEAEIDAVEGSIRMLESAVL